MQFRTAHKSDLDVLNAISIQSKSHWGYPENWIEGWKSDLTLTLDDLKSMDVLMICEGSDIAGFCAVSEAISNYEIEHLWILPEFIGKGYGKELLKKSIETFDLESKDILVTADPHAEEFYQKCGFKTISWIESTPSGRLLPVMRRESK